MENNNTIWGVAFAKRDFTTKQLNTNQYDVLQEGSVKAANGDYVKVDIAKFIKDATKPIKITIMPNDKNGNPNKTKNGDAYYKIRIMEVEKNGQYNSPQSGEAQTKEKPAPQYMGDENIPF